jgi:hypothetical protein
MTIESILCAKLGIRFVDARNLSVQAKLNLGLSGYAGKDQEGMIFHEAVKIFAENIPDAEKETMRNTRRKLDFLLNCCHTDHDMSCSKGEGDDTTGISDFSESSRSDFSSTPSEASKNSNKSNRSLGIKRWSARKA